MFSPWSHWFLELRTASLDQQASAALGLQCQPQPLAVVPGQPNLVAPRSAGVLRRLILGAVLRLQAHSRLSRSLRINLLVQHSLLLQLQPRVVVLAARLNQRLLLLIVPIAVCHQLQRLTIAVGIIHSSNLAHVRFSQEDPVVKLAVAISGIDIATQRARFSFLCDLRASAFQKFDDEREAGMFVLASCLVTDQVRVGLPRTSCCRSLTLSAEILRLPAVTSR